MSPTARWRARDMNAAEPPVRIGHILAGKHLVERLLGMDGMDGMRVQAAPFDMDHT